MRAALGAIICIIFSRKRSEGFFFSVLGECEGRQSDPEGGRKPRNTAEYRGIPPNTADIRHTN